MYARRRLIVGAVFVTALVALAVNAENNEVKQLTDANFEHDTQASTGSTTGPWFVKFYAPWCGHCKTMKPAWEKLATELKGKINVAEIDATQNSVTARRFGIRGFPTIIFLNKGKMYPYEKERNVEKMKAFAEGGWKSVAKPVDVPKPMSTLDIYKDELYNAIMQLHGIGLHAPLSFCLILGAGALIGIIFSCLIYCCWGKSNQASEASRRAKMKKKD